MDRDRKQPIQKDEIDGKGRTSNTGQNASNSNNQHDISQVDRQEGEMDHGETGGSQKRQNQEKS